MVNLNAQEEDDIDIENSFEANLITQGYEPAPYTFTIEQFKKDYLNLVKFYWYSNSTFRTNDEIQEKKIKDNDKLEEKLFKIDDENNIDSERLLLLVKRDFGMDNSKRDATCKEKIFQKLFYISYTCNELISDLCGKGNQKDFKYSSIYNFYYIVSLSYNKAIQGFEDIIKEITDDNDDDNDAPPLA